MPNYTELSKRASDLMMSGADPSETEQAYQKMLDAAPGAERRAQVLEVRMSIAETMDMNADLRKRDGEARLDAYCRLLEEDDTMRKLYRLYDEIGRLLP